MHIEFFSNDAENQFNSKLHFHAAESLDGKTEQLSKQIALVCHAVSNNQVRSLNLSNYNLSSTHISQLSEALTVNKTLISLFLGSTGIDNITRLADALNEHPAIRHLSLSDNPIQNINCLTPLFERKQLVSLDLSEIDGGAVECLTKGLNPESSCLKRLNLNMTPGDYTELFPVLSHLPLTHLDVNDCEIINVEPLIFFIKNCRTLVSLDISCNFEQDELIIIFEALKDCPKIKKLRFGSCDTSGDSPLASLILENEHLTQITYNCDEFSQKDELKAAKFFSELAMALETNDTVKKLTVYTYPSQIIRRYYSLLKYTPTIDDSFSSCELVLTSANCQLLAKNHLLSDLEQRIEKLQTQPNDFFEHPTSLSEMNKMIRELRMHYTFLNKSLNKINLITNTKQCCEISHLSHIQNRNMEENYRLLQLCLKQIDVQMDEERYKLNIILHNALFDCLIQFNLITDEIYSNYNATTIVQLILEENLPRQFDTVLSNLDLDNEKQCQKVLIDIITHMHHFSSEVNFAEHKRTNAQPSQENVQSKKPALPYSARHSFLGKRGPSISHNPKTKRTCLENTNTFK